MTIPLKAGADSFRRLLGRECKILPREQSNDDPIAILQPQPRREFLTSEYLNEL